MRYAPDTLRVARALGVGLVLLGIAVSGSFGDEPQPGGRLARFFRFGGAASPSANESGHDHYGSSRPGPGSNATAPAAGSVLYQAPTPGPGGMAPGPVSTPEVGPGGSGPRIVPQPRNSRGATEADPLFTRVAIGRADGGGQFSMFLQVFADGTVIDSEGVHKVGGDALRPVVEALRQPDLYRLRGHCRAPSTDFIELSHLVVFERRLGTLKATSLSYSGNPQGCDPSLKRLHAAIEALQMKMATPAGATPTPAPIAPRPGGDPAPILGLTPPNPNP